jgi:hypothetical protein
MIDELDLEGVLHGEYDEAVQNEIDGIIIVIHFNTFTSQVHKLIVEGLGLTFGERV